MNRRTRYFHAILDRLFLRIQAWECRQQRRVNIHDPRREPVDKTRAENPHEPGQHHQFDMMQVELGNDSFLKVLFGGKIPAFDHCRWDTGSSYLAQGVGLRIVADHHANLGSQPVCIDRIENRLQIATAT